LFAIHLVGGAAFFCSARLVIELFLSRDALSLTIIFTLIVFEQSSTPGLAQPLKSKENPIF
jgi:hypothetical protein